LFAFFEDFCHPVASCDNKANTVMSLSKLNKKALALSLDCVRALGDGWADILHSLLPSANDLATRIESGVKSWFEPGHARSMALKRWVSNFDVNDALSSWLKTLPGSYRDLVILLPTYIWDSDDPLEFAL
jgi:hypothetical protein